MPAETRQKWRKRAKGHVANRDAALAQLRQDNTTKANAVELQAQANMAVVQQKSRLEQLRGVNQRMDTDLRSRGQLNLASVNNDASAQRQLAGFNQQNKVTMQGQNWDKDKMRMDRDNRMEDAGITRGWAVEDAAMQQGYAQELAAQRMGGQAYLKTGSGDVAQVLAGSADIGGVDYANAPSFTPVGTEKDLGYSHVAAQLGDPNQGGYAFDKRTGTTKPATNEAVSYHTSKFAEMQKSGDRQGAINYLNALKVTAPDIYQQLMAANQ